MEPLSVLLVINKGIHELKLDSPHKGPITEIVDVFLVTGLLKLSHYSDVIMSAMASQITRLFTQLFIQAQIKENIKAPRQWPSWGESFGDRWIPLTKG